MTMDQLKKRGFQMASRCPLCGKAEEVLDHLLIHCPPFGDYGLGSFPFQGFTGSTPI